jgi:DtxR family Mn-dependent transcriptional regulator
MLTESTEMYLITIYRLTRDRPYASNSDIAAMLGISLSSASEKIKRLTMDGFLAHEAHEGTTLSEEGQRIALSVVRKHRLMETFMVNMAGYQIDEVHEEACRLEHAISDRLADALEVMLGHPAVDPHGHPIPSKDGQIAALDCMALVDVEAGETVTICRVEDLDAERLTYVRELGLVPGTVVIVSEIAPFDGPIILTVDDQTVAVARNVAREIGVTRDTM